MADEEQALAAIEGLNGADFQGRPLTVNRLAPRAAGGPNGGAVVGSVAARAAAAAGPVVATRAAMAVVAVAAAAAAGSTASSLCESQSKKRASPLGEALFFLRG